MPYWSRGRGPVPEVSRIGAAIRSEKERLWRECPGLGLQSLWEAAAGADIAANTRVQSLRDGVMTVSCESGGWACELRLVADELAARLNASGPPERIEGLRFIHRARLGCKARK